MLLFQTFKATADKASNTRCLILRQFPEEAAEGDFIRPFEKMMIRVLKHITSRFSERKIPVRGWLPINQDFSFSGQEQSVEVLGPRSFLPLPFCPIIATISPRWISVTFSASASPYRCAKICALDQWLVEFSSSAFLWPPFPGARSLIVISDLKVSHLHQGKRQPDNPLP